MLSRTLSTDFAPGTNLKHDLAGASWTYLLPSMELQHVLCIGEVSSDALITLSRICEKLTIVHDKSETLSEFVDSGNVSVVADICEIRSPNGAGVDLVYLADVSAHRRFQRDEVFQKALRQLVHERSLLYLESGPIRRLLDRRLFAVRELSWPASQVFWITPWQGEMRTAVPTGDHEMIDFFLRQKLFSPSLNVSVLKHALVGRTGRKMGVSRQRGRKEKGRSLLKRTWYQAKKVLRAVGARLVSVSSRVERLLLKQTRVFRRHGTFLRPRLEVDDMRLQGPPHYLQEIAAAADIGIKDCRWGFSARGRYSSRKIIFYLFKRREHEREDQSANYIVKMVRDPAYNARLENEYRALTWLENHGLSDKVVFPRALFFDYHKNLAVAGESYIDGVPLRAQTHATPSCPYARDVIASLVHLGRASAGSSTANPEALFATLQKLLDSFTKLYSPSKKIQHFLADRIAAMQDLQAGVPLVFQHGDPGTWNILVTKGRRAAFLDWEAAERSGMPLWDLFYFLRSYCTWVAQTRGTRDSLKGFAEQFLSDSPMAQLVVEATVRYCREVSLPMEAVEPLFYTCWMHRALKQARSLPAHDLASGHYLNLLQLTIDERRNSPTLCRIFHS